MIDRCGKAQWPFLMEGSVDDYAHQENIALFRKKLAEPHNDQERGVILKLLAEEAKLLRSRPKR
ncbi:hypothetical protein PMI42_03072 [Bradyrhizobium sp. YR681]|nr:hypothetical protein PMI42_03072 [Bradyrhizobium sp. YR681]